MAEDLEDKRKIAKNWREYFSDTKESIAIARWAFKEFASPEAKRMMKYLFAALAVVTTLGMIQPLALRAITDGLIAHNLTKVKWSFGVLLVVMLAQHLCQHIQDKLREYIVGQDLGRLDARTSELFFEKSLGQHLADDGLLNAASVDRGKSRAFELEQLFLFEGFEVLFQLLFAFIFLCLLSIVAGIVATVILAIYVLFAFYLNQRVVQTCVPLDKKFRALNRFRVQRLDYIERVKTSGKEHDELAHQCAEFKNLIGQDRRFWFWFINVATVRGLLNRISVLVIMAYGVWRVSRGEWTVGLLFPLFSWTTSVSEHLWRIGHFEHKLNWNMPSVKGLKEALSCQPLVVDAPDAIEFKKTDQLQIEFQNVTYHYPKKEDELNLHVLRNISFDIGSGEKVALIGPSGAGKTTIMRLALWYMNPESGSIMVNGRDLRSYSRVSWLKQIGYIPQQAQIMDGTIRYNLTYSLSNEARSAVTDEELWALMRNLEIDFGTRLKNGLDTPVGRNGIQLSGGEAQRLMIGAAVLPKPKLMIIDEATSSLDSSTEKKVQLGLSKLLGSEMSALIITHRLNTVRNLCGKFIVLRSSKNLTDDDNQIEAIADSFEELYQVSPTFRQLAIDQGLVILPSAKLIAQR